jgi:hypothetical protein
MKLWSYWQLMMGYAVVQLVEERRYKPEGRGFNFLPAAPLPLGRLSL